MMLSSTCKLHSDSRRLGSRRSFVPRLDVLEDRTLPSTFTVTNLLDAGDGSLRQAVIDVNRVSEESVILFDVTGTIELASPLPDLATNLNIEGPGANQLAVQRSTADGTPDFSIFTISSTATVVLSGLTIADGSATLGGGIFNDGGSLTVSDSILADNLALTGGGITNFGSLTVSNSTLANNIADSKGGGIANFGVLSISYSTLSGNSASTGGAIYNFDGAILTVSYSTVRSNFAHFGGGIGINGGMVTLTNSTLTGNSAGVGAGVLNLFSGILSVSNCTFAGNSAADEGGAIENDTGAIATVDNSTVSVNSAARGGGVFNDGSLACRDTILAGNTAADGPDLFGNLISQGHNLFGDGTGGNGFDVSDLLNVNPLLGPLQDNGGPTWTIPLLPGSPAVDAGGSQDVPEWDQRGAGFPRVVDNRMDIGAFQVQPGPATHFQLMAPAVVTSDIPFDVTVTALDAYDHTAVGYVGRVSFSSNDKDPDVGLPYDYVFTAGDRGVHTFRGGFTLASVGDQTLTAVDTVDYTIAASVIVSVEPAPAAPVGSGSKRTKEGAAAIGSVDRFMACVSRPEMPLVWAALGQSASLAAKWTR
jgi:hypothetical protein